MNGRSRLSSRGCEGSLFRYSMRARTLERSHSSTRVDGSKAILPYHIFTAIGPIIVFGSMEAP